MMASKKKIDKNRLVDFLRILELIVMRDYIWNLVTAKYPEGMLLPRWTMVVRATLYPIEFFCKKRGDTNGYQYENDTWNIYGVKYTGTCLQTLAKSQGETYRITRTGECVTLLRVGGANMKDEYGLDSEILIQQAIKQATPLARKTPRWVVVKRLFCTEQHVSRAICTKYGFDPDEEIQPLVRLSDDDYE